MEDNEFIEQLLDLPTFYQLHRSPNGKYIAFMASGYQDNYDVFYMDIENPNEVVPLTQSNEYTRMVQWWPDSQSVVIVEDKGGNERDVLYRVYLNQPLVIHPISNESPEYYMRAPHITKDEKYLYFAANYDFTIQKETESVGIFKQTLLSEEIVELARTEKPVFMDMKVSPNGKYIVYSKSDIDPSGTQVWMVNCDGSDNHELLNFGDKAEVQFSWHPESKEVVFVTNMLENKFLENRAVGIFDIVLQFISWVNQKEENIFATLVEKNISSAYFDKYEPNMLILEETVRTKPVYHLFDRRDSCLYNLDIETGNFILENRLDNTRWLGRYFASNQPATPVIIEDRNLETLKFADLHFIEDNFSSSKLTQNMLTKCHEYMWESKGETIYGWLYEPKEKSKGLIVFVHGGPTYHSSDNINHEIQYYVYRGYTVLDPNYRGSTGYGVRFQELIKQEGWGGSEQDDIANGVLALIEEGYARYGKIGITGTSYGGYSSWYAITKFPDLFNVCAPVCGMTDLVIDYETTRPDLRPYSESMMSGSPTEVPEKYYERSPVNFIPNISGNVLIIQGKNDPNVHPKNVEVVDMLLKKSNVSFKVKIFDDEGHGIAKKSNKIVKFQEILSYFEKRFDEV